jgi:ERCC4-type nuclease
VARQISAVVRDDGYARPGFRPKGWKKRSLYLLQGLPEVGPKRAAELLAAYGSVRAVFAADEARLASVSGLGPSIAEGIVKAIGEAPSRDLELADFRRTKVHRGRHLDD